MNDLNKSSGKATGELSDTELAKWVAADRDAKASFPTPVPTTAAEWRKETAAVNDPDGLDIRLMKAVTSDPKFWQKNSDIAFADEAENAPAEELTEKERAYILRWYEEGVDSKKISTMVKKPQSVVDSVIQQHEEEKGNEKQKKAVANETSLLNQVLAGLNPSKVTAMKTKMAVAAPSNVVTELGSKLASQMNGK